MGEDIFVQSDDNRKAGDTYRSLRERFENNQEIKKSKGDKEKQASIACKTWYDVRAFGQVFPFKKISKDSEKGESDSVSIGIRGPVTIQSAFSLKPVEIYSQQIMKSVNLETGKKGPDTVGMKHRVEYGIYVAYGSINCQLAEKTGFSDEDADKLLTALKTLFVNDESSARPSGTMKVEKVVWWRHNCKNGQYASADVHDSIEIREDEGRLILETKCKLEGLEAVFYDGINR